MLILLLLIGLACFAGAYVLMQRLRLAICWWTGLAGHRTESELANLFVFIPATRLVGISILAAAACLLVGLLLGVPVPVLGLSCAASLAAPRMVLHGLRSRRRHVLARQFPDALTLWAGLLRAGQSSQQALSQVALRQPAPLCDELRMVLGQLRVGVPLEEAIAALRERAGLPDLRLLSTLLATQRELGGNLAESLQRLAEILRNRLLMEARIASLTAQGRMQGVVVGVLPLLLMAVLYVMETEAMQVLHTTWQGWIALGVIGLLELTGFVLIRRIVKIEI